MSTPENRYDLIIIGSGPAGASAAIYAGRAMLKTLVIASGESGGQIRITSEIVNYPGVPEISGAQFGENLRAQVARFGAEQISANVTGIDLSGPLKKVVTDSGTYEAVALIAATGATPRKLGFPGEDQFQGHGVGYCATCDGEFFTGMDIFVVGAGFAAAEEAIFLTRYGKKVHLIAREPDFTCAPSIGAKVREQENIEIHFNTEVVSLEGDSVPRRITLRNNVSGQEWTFTPEAPNDTFGVFIFVGYEPQSQLFRDKLNLDAGGYIPTGEEMQTSAEGVYAAGDIRPKQLRQLVTAVSDGAIAATAAERYITEKKAELGITVEQSQQQEEAPHHAVQSIISDELAGQLAPILERFENPVTLMGFLERDDELSEEIQVFLEDLSSLSDKISVEILYHGEEPELEEKLALRRFPTIVLLDHEGGDTNVHYQALPSGHEFNSFVLALYNAAGPGQSVDDVTLERILSLDKPVHVEVGMSLSCTMCPDVVQALQQIAMKNPNLRLDIVDVFRFPEFKKKYNIMSVPALVINGNPPQFGKKSMEELLELLSRAS
ncbi:MAG: FAD-dependent oxidoreductase [Oscillospiraceae bacterium]